MTEPEGLSGYDYTIVNGEILMDHGEHTDNLAGRLVEGPTPRMLRTEGGPRWAGPTGGEHNNEILSDFLGYNRDKIAELAIAGVLE